MKFHEASDSTFQANRATEVKQAIESVLLPPVKTPEEKKQESRGEESSSKKRAFDVLPSELDDSLSTYKIGSLDEFRLHAFRKQKRDPTVDPGGGNAPYDYERERAEDEAQDREMEEFMEGNNPYKRKAAAAERKSVAAAKRKAGNTSDSDGGSSEAPPAGSQSKSLRRFFSFQDADGVSQEKKQEHRETDRSKEEGGGGGEEEGGGWNTYRMEDEDEDEEEEKRKEVSGEGSAKQRRHFRVLTREEIEQRRKKQNPRPYSGDDQREPEGDDPVRSMSSADLDRGFQEAWESIGQAALEIYNRDVDKWSEAQQKANLDLMRSLVGMSKSEIQAYDKRLDNEAQGGAAYQAGMDAIKRLDIKPTIQQYTFIRMIFDAALKLIYGKEEFEKFKPQLLKQKGMESFPHSAWLSCPRQFGKSTTVAIAIAALLFICKGIRVICIANSQEIASKLLGTILSFFVQMCGGSSERLLWNNKKHAAILNPDVDLNMTSLRQVKTERLMNTVMACSSSADSNRGLSCDLLVIDEAAFLPDKTITDFIAPLAGSGEAGSVVTIALSTTSGEDNYFSRVLQRDDAEIKKIAYVLWVKLICKECEKKGLLECVHTKDIQPPHNTGDNRPIQQLFVSDHNKILQETMGMIVGSQKGHLFSKQLMESIFVRDVPPVQSWGPRTFVTFIDPKGKSKANDRAVFSNFALVTVCITQNDEVVLIGADETPESFSTPKTKFIEDYFSNLLEHPLCDASTSWVVVTENNFGNEAEEWAKVAKRVSNIKYPDGSYCVVQYNKSDEEMGAQTDLRNKPKSMEQMFMDLSSDNIFALEPLVCSKSGDHTRVQNLLIKQMSSIRVHGRSKMDGKGPGENDDMAIAFILGTYFARKYIEEVKNIGLLRQFDLLKKRQQIILEDRARTLQFNQRNTMQEAY